MIFTNNYFVPQLRKNFVVSNSPVCKALFFKLFWSENCNTGALRKHALAAAWGDQSYKISIAAENYCKIFLHRRRLETRVFAKTPFLTFLSSKRLENKYATLKLAVESEFEENFELSPEEKI